LGIRDLGMEGWLKGEIEKKPPRKGRRDV